ncbi:MAG: hypothetical protein U0Q55_21445 [Vicinamibacterales bacterium]
MALIALAAFGLCLEPRLQAAAANAVKAGGTSRAATASALTLPAGVALDGFKLLLAAAIGSLITAVQHRTRRDLPLTRSMAQTYVLLCVAGALTMTMIGESLPRAFAVGGAASIVKFRTPVDDPRDGTALFLLMGLGMACGVGAFSIAVLGALFLAGCLVVLSRQGGDAMPRSMRLAVIADGTAFPVAHVTQVFSHYQIHAEPFEISHGEQTVIRYKAVLSGERALEEVSRQLLDDGGAGIKSVSWETPKRWI